jgi:hypothetical protein
MNYRPSDTPVAGTRARTEDYNTASFLARLARMSPAARLEGYRYGFTARQRTIWIAHYPDEVPIINGEYEHIALALADLD